MDDDEGEWMEATPADVDDPPLEAGTGHFHFGAASFGWIWLYAHGMPGVALADLLLTAGTGWSGVVLLLAASPLGAPIGLLAWLWALLAAVVAGWRVYLGTVGRRWAWQHRKYPDVEDFKRVELVWSWWVVYVWVAGCVVGLALQALEFVR